MDESMKKILYYENIIEFKNNTNSPLLLQDVKNWELCCTCLRDADPEASKIRIIGNYGQYLNIVDMLKAIMGEEYILPEEQSNFCRDCLEKVTTLYYFKLQIKRAHGVLIRLRNKLNENIQSIEILNEGPKIQLNYKNSDTITSHECSSSGSPRVSTTIQSIEVTDDLSIEDYDKSGDEIILKSASIVEGDMSVVNVHEIEGFYDAEVNDEDNASETIEYYDEQELVDEIMLDTQEKHEEEDEEFALEDNEIEVSNDKNSKSDDANESESKKSPAKTGRRRTKIAKLLLESNKCDLCDAEFDMQRNLVQHVKEEHPNTRAFKCIYCSKRFGHLQSLSRHIQTHRPDPKRICCEHCGRCFKRCDDLKRHKRIHTGERPYACTECDKSFKQHSELSSHKQTHFAFKKYECDICGHVLNSRNGMYVHKKTHGRVKKHNCLYCDKVFLKAADLHNHMKVHKEKKSPSASSSNTD